MTPRQWSGFAGAGVYVGCPASVYHSDPCPQPSLSNSLLQTLLDSSPLHARHAHPRLNANARERDSSRRAEIGSVAHELALMAGADVDVLDFGDYRKKAAQEARDASELAGRIPVLAADYARAEHLAGGLRAAAENYLGAPMTECLREVVMLWEENGYWRRAMVDCLNPAQLVMCDLKTTEASVSPAACARRIYEGMHIQSGFYTRGMEALDPENAGRWIFGFVFAEQRQPFALSPPIELSEAGMTMARQQIDTGCALWDSCLKSNRWPGYGSETYIAEPPSWAMAQWTERAMSDERLNPVDSIEKTGWTQ